MELGEHYRAAVCLAVLGGLPLVAAAQGIPGFPCQPVVCSTLLPATPVADPGTNDCAYRAGNL
jgi:hypothetical protein